MENLSKYITDGEDPVLELAPPIENAQIVNAASQIIETIGVDRSSDSRILQEAEWYDSDDNKHWLKRVIHEGNLWLFLDVYRPVDNKKPFLRYGFAGVEGGGMRMYDPDSEKRQQVKVNKSIIEEDMIDRLIESGVVEANKASSESDDSEYWEIVSRSIAEQENIRRAVKYGQDLPVYVSREKIYNLARAAIAEQEPALPKRIVDRIIDYSLETIYPGDMPELTIGDMDTSLD